MCSSAMGMQRGSTLTMRSWHRRGTGEDSCALVMTMLGHRVSEGERVQMSDIAEYVDPVITHCTAMAAKYPGLPLFMVGHSMGGLIALLTVLKTQVTYILSFGD